MYRLWIVSLAELRVIYTRFWPHLQKRDGFIFPHISQEEFLAILFASLGMNNQKDSVRKTNQNSLNKNQSLTNASELDYVSMRSGISNIETGFVQTSRGSSGSNDSLNSLMSTNTIASNSSSMRRERKKDLSSEFEGFDFISSPNFLPIVTCRFVTNPRDNHENRLLYIDLNLIVYETRGYLFICCPALSSSRMINTDKTTFEDFFLDEQNISLSYSTLQAMSNYFFEFKKNLKSLETFITENMPFGTLINDLRPKIDFGSEQKLTKMSSESIKQQFLIHLTINEYISSSLLNDSETIFGTLDIIPNSIFLEKIPGKVDLKLTIDNLERFTLARPFNCDISSTGFVFNLKKSKIPPFSLLHYRTESFPEYSSNASYSDQQTSIFNRKLFNYRYTITKKAQDNNNNLYHLQLIVGLNSNFVCDDLKFQVFTIRFSLMQQQSKIQTATSSFVNLLVRESIKLSGGQIRNESNTCAWNLTKVPKKGRYTFDLDILLPEDCAKRLETTASFRLENHFQTRFKDEKYEANLRFQNNKIQSEMALSSATLLIGNGFKSQHPILLDYRLQSFEYRLFPKWIDI